MSQAQAQAWKNRIVGYADVDPSQLLANPANYRRHPKPQQEALSGLIDEIGYLDPVLCQAGTDLVIDGHLRVELALRQNQKTIPVKYVDLTDAEAALALATFDPITALAYSDAEQLRALLDEVSTGDAAVMALLADLAEREGIVPPEKFDPNEHWTGMPEFENENQLPVKQVMINFASVDDLERFSRVIEQKITLETKSVWYPSRNLESIRDAVYVGEESDAA